MGREGGQGEWSTCPPEKPTATTPSSLGLEMNFWGIVEGEVMVEGVVEGDCARSKEVKGRMF